MLARSTFPRLPLGGGCRCSQRSGQWPPPLGRLPLPCMPPPRCLGLHRKAGRGRRWVWVLVSAITPAISHARISVCLGALRVLRCRGCMPPRGVRHGGPWPKVIDNKCQPVHAGLGGLSLQTRAGAVTPGAVASLPVVRTNSLGRKWPGRANWPFHFYGTLFDSSGTPCEFFSLLWHL